MSRRLFLRSRFVLVGLLALVAVQTEATPLGLLFDEKELTTVNSKEFNGYVRRKDPDGTFERETFVFGQGGDLLDLIKGGRFRQGMRDPSMDDILFSEILKILAGPLAEQNYVTARDPKATKLLIMVYWGTTVGGVNSILGNVQDAFNSVNARLLGFDKEAKFLQETSGASIHGHVLRELNSEQLSDIEVNRYYVILRAFDFQTVLRQKKYVLQWETRFSVFQRNHAFDADLPMMAASASPFFGRDSHGLTRPPVREGKVEIGELKSLDDSASSTDENAGAASMLAGEWFGTSPAENSLVVHIDGNGNATVENRGRGWVRPAQVDVSGNEVTIAIPGWNIFFRGKRAGDRIKGTLSEYGRVTSWIFRNAALNTKSNLQPKSTGP